MRKLVSVLATTALAAAIAPVIIAPAAQAAACGFVTGMSVNGTRQVRQTLTVENIVYSGPTPTITYDWQNMDAEFQDVIYTSSANTFTLPDDLANVRIRVRLTVDNGVDPVCTYSGTTFTVAGIPVTMEGPVISGIAGVTATVSAQVTITSGVPAVTDYVYWWSYSDDPALPFSDVPGGRGPTLTLDESLYGKYLVVYVYAANSAGSYAENTSAVFGPIGDRTPQVQSVTIDGTAQRGQRLTANPTVVGYPTPTVTYQWRRSVDALTWTDIPLAVQPTYDVTEADAAQYIAVKVTATQGMFLADRQSGPTARVPGIAPAIASVSITGNAVAGSRLRATPGSTSGAPTPTITYQWQRKQGSTAWTDINRATGSTYTLAAGDAGYVVRVIATAGNLVTPDATATSTATAKVLSAPTRPARPTGVKAVFKRNAITVTWQKVAAPADDPITGYNVRCALKRPATTLTDNVSGRTTTVSFAKPRSGSYSCTVAATKQRGGRGSASTPVTVVVH